MRQFSTIWRSTLIVVLLGIEQEFRDCQNFKLRDRVQRRLWSSCRHLGTWKSFSLLWYDAFSCKILREPQSLKSSYSPESQFPFRVQLQTLCKSSHFFFRSARLKIVQLVPKYPPRPRDSTSDRKRVPRLHLSTLIHPIHGTREAILPTVSQLVIILLVFFQIVHRSNGSNVFVSS